MSASTLPPTMTDWVTVRAALRVALALVEQLDLRDFHLLRERADAGLET